jgi:hypothetical protein
MRVKAEKQGKPKTVAAGHYPKPFRKGMLAPCVKNDETLSAIVYTPTKQTIELSIASAISLKGEFHD